MKRYMTNSTLSQGGRKRPIVSLRMKTTFRSMVSKKKHLSVYAIYTFAIHIGTNFA